MKTMRLYLTIRPRPRRDLSLIKGAGVENQRACRCVIGQVGRANRVELRDDDCRRVLRDTRDIILDNGRITEDLIDILKTTRKRLVVSGQGPRSIELASS